MILITLEEFEWMARRYKRLCKKRFVAVTSWDFGYYPGISRVIAFEQDVRAALQRYRHV